MKSKAYVVLVYALLILIGGLIGYLKAGSVISIVTSTVFALITAASGFAMLKNSVLGRFISTGVCLALAIFFCYRFLIAFTFMPAGLMTIVSLIVLAVLLKPTKASVKC